MSPGRLNSYKQTRLTLSSVQPNSFPKYIFVLILFNVCSSVPSFKFAVLFILLAELKFFSS